MICLSIQTRKISGIEGAFYGAGAKTVIPRKVIGKFSIRLVPDQLPEEVEKKVRDHINNVVKKQGSPNKVTLVYIFKLGKFTCYTSLHRRGVYCFTSVRPSICLSFRPSQDIFHRIFLSNY